MMSALLLEYCWIPVKTGLTDGYVYPSTSKDTEVAEMLCPEWQKWQIFENSFQIPSNLGEMSDIYHFLTRVVHLLLHIRSAAVIVGPS